MDNAHSAKEHKQDNLEKRNKKMRQILEILSFFQSIISVVDLISTYYFINTVHLIFCINKGGLFLDTDSLKDLSHMPQEC